MTNSLPFSTLDSAYSLKGSQLAGSSLRSSKNDSARARPDKAVEGRGREAKLAQESNAVLSMLYSFEMF